MAYNGSRWLVCGLCCRIRNPLDTSNFDNFDNVDVDAPPVPADRLERHNQQWELWDWLDTDSK